MMVEISTIQNELAERLGEAEQPGGHLGDLGEAVEGRVEEQHRARVGDRSPP